MNKAVANLVCKVMEGCQHEMVDYILADKYYRTTSYDNSFDEVVTDGEVPVLEVSMCSICAKVLDVRELIENGHVVDVNEGFPSCEYLLEDSPDCEYLPEDKEECDESSDVPRADEDQ